jgi:hypothetical protein
MTDEPREPTDPFETRLAADLRDAMRVAYRSGVAGSVAAAAVRTNRRSGWRWGWSAPRVLVVVILVALMVLAATASLGSAPNRLGEVPTERPSLPAIVERPTASPSAPDSAPFVQSPGPVQSPLASPTVLSLVGATDGHAQQIGPLAAGTYDILAVDHTGFNFRVTVPAGWRWDGRALRIGSTGTEGAAVYFFGGPLQVYRPCQWTAAPPVVEAFEAVQMMKQLGTVLGATPPVDRNMSSLGVPGRWTGSTVELTVPDDSSSFAGCDHDRYVLWGPSDRARTVDGPGERDLVWAADNGFGGAGLAVVDAASFPNTPSAILAQMNAILESIQTGHWG